ncbi:MAG: hypothetical protein RLZ44_1472 [Pseudomonadota bacterium]
MGRVRRKLIPVLLLWSVALPAAAETLWARAVRTNDTTTLAQLLPQQRLPDEPARDGKTALMAAAAAGDLVLLRRLLAAGADPHAVNSKGASALIYAAWGGAAAAVAELLARAVALEQTASNGWTALTMAAAKGHVECVRLLLAAGARVDPPDVYGWTPLMRAADRHRDGVVEVLVRDGGASLTAGNAQGQTALHAAAAAGNRSTYALLLQLGADPERRDFAGHSPRDVVAAGAWDNPPGSPAAAGSN